MAAMSVIGIDFGNESCYIAAARAGGIETLANDYSLRATPACVAFTPKNRILGVAAKNQLVTNMKNTVHGFKRLLGRKYDDPSVQSELQHLPYVVERGHDGNIGIRVQYRNQDQAFSPEQISAMLFGKLKEIAETALQTKVNDCVISVPAFFTNVERQSLLDSAHIAGLNVLRLMNETLATALAYGIYKQDLPEPEAKPRNVVFVDWGQSALQVSACAFHKGKLKMLSSNGDANLGGRDIDIILAEYFNNHFRSQYRLDAKTNARAMVRLLTEVEKIKKQMSANSTTLPLNIECFMDDKDVRGEIKRADMEQLCANLFERAEKVMRKFLEESKLRVDDIHSVEIVGGSSRVPALKNLIAKVFGHQPSTTLNQDEAVSRGCALQCALLSPAVRVRDFSISDVQAYPIKLVWDPAMGEDDAEMEVFPKNHVVPFSKMLTFFRTGPFALRAVYNGEVPHTDPKLGEFIVKDVKPSPTGESQKVKVKVRVNIHGVFKVSSASLVELAKAPAPGEEKEPSSEPMEVEQQQEQQQQSPKKQENGPKSDEGEGEGMEDAGEKDKKGSKKAKVVCTELPVECKSQGLTPDDLNGCQEMEYQMIAEDRQEKERADARNALEEYVYELRGKLGNEEELATFVEEKERSSLSAALDDMENWLYEEGEDCLRQAYVDRLSQLKARGEPIKVRRQESQGRATALEELSHSLMLARKALGAAETGDERYNHLTTEELQKLHQGVEKSSHWLEEQRALLARTPRTQDPPVLVATIRQEKQSFDSLAGSVLNKPKPKVEPPPAPAKEEAPPSEPTNKPTENSNGQPTVEMDTD